MPRPCFAALKGEAKNRAVESCRAVCRLMGFSPNTETFSAVHPISVAAVIGRARSLGVLRGRSRIEFIVSPLPRRRHNESHFAAQSPERSFFFEFFFLRERKTDWLRRCRKISVRKLNPTTATNQTLSPANLICTLSSSHAAAKPAAMQASFMSVP